MSCPGTPVLLSLLDEHPDLLPAVPELAALDAAGRLALYDRVLPEAERHLWQADDAAFDARLARYQALFREQQALIDATGQGDTAPFRARPSRRRSPGACAHLPGKHPPAVPAVRLRRAGCEWARAARVTVIVAEDSREARQSRRHRALATHSAARGCRCVHFDLPEQYALLQTIPETERRQLGAPADRPSRRSASSERAGGEPQSRYLKMLQLTQDRARTLYYLVDSDQSFEVNRQRPRASVRRGAFSYFHAIDRMFRTTRHPHADRQAGRRSAGVAGGDGGEFPRRCGGVPATHRGLRSARRVQLSRPQAAPLPGDAAYHDMAEAVRPGPGEHHFDYRCPLEGAHDHTACLAGISRAACDAFFFGEHLTRRTRFDTRGRWMDADARAHHLPRQHRGELRRPQNHHPVRPPAPAHVRPHGGAPDPGRDRRALRLGQPADAAPPHRRGRRGRTNSAPAWRRTTARSTSPTNSSASSSAT